MLRTCAVRLPAIEVHAVGQVLPGTGDPFHFGLPAEFPFGADFARDARHFRGEGAELIDHRIDRIFEFENFALHVDGDLLGQVAIGHGGGHFGDVTDLTGEVSGHEVHVVGQVFPSSGDAFTSACPPSFPSVPTSRATRVTSEANELKLIDHRVDRVLQLENFALHVDGDLLRQVTVGHGGRHRRDVSHLSGQVAAMKFTLSVRVFPGAGNAFDASLPTEFSFGTDFAGDAGHFRGEGSKLIDHRVDRVLSVQEFAADVDGDFLGQVAVRHGGCHFGDVAYLTGQVPGHGVHAIGQDLATFPRPPFTAACPPSLPSVPTSRATALLQKRTSRADRPFDSPVLAVRRNSPSSGTAVQVERHRLR